MILMGVYCLLLVIDCCFSNYPIFESMHKGIFSETDVLMSLHDSVNGYNGLLEMLVVYTLPFLLGAYCVRDKESSYCIIRNNTRTRYKRMEILKMVLAALGFMFLHQLIDYIYISVNFKKSFLMEYSFVTYTIVFGIIACLFYIQTGFLYQILYDLTGTDIMAFLVTLIINLIQYLGIKYYIFSGWIPGKDLMAAFEYLNGNVGFSAIVITILRSLLVTVCLYAVSQMIFEKKDILKNEK